MAMFPRIPASFGGQEAFAQFAESEHANPLAAVRDQWPHKLECAAFSHRDLPYLKLFASPINLDGRLYFQIRPPRPSCTLSLFFQHSFLSQSFGILGFFPGALSMLGFLGWRDTFGFQQSLPIFSMWMALTILRRCLCGLASLCLQQPR